MVSKKDKSVFSEAMQDDNVVPLGEKKQPPKNKRNTHNTHNIHRSKNLEADMPFVIKTFVSGDEIIYYCQANYRRTQNYHRLKKGKIAPQFTLDLHDHTLAMANQVLADLLNQISYDCIRIIHGKGQHSKDSRALLKSLVAQKLKEYERVIAYHSCPDKYGGSGAVLVLLRT